MREPRLNQVRLIRLTLVLILTLLSGVLLAHAFAEEPLGFREDGVTFPTPPEISTVHDDMTFVLALAAGFTVTDAHTLRIWDQLTDSELLSGTQVYSNGVGGAYYTVPNSRTICGGLPANHVQVIWPRWQDMTISTSITSRFGPYSPYFHFPHLDGPRAANEIDALRDWGWGFTTTLRAYEAYAWGSQTDLTVMRANCLYTRTAAITTSIQAGSLPAFATYLHSLADGYSHRDCIAALDALGMPWSTHTTPPIDDSVPACDYYPRTPSADDVHGREFYTYTDSLRTTEALRHVYLELAARSFAREGVYVPLDLNTTISGSQTLSETIGIFVHNWDFDQPQARRDYADALVQKLSELTRTPLRRVYLPLTFK